MATRSGAPISQRYGAELRRFLVVEIPATEEREAEGLLRFKLDALLPHGLEGFRFFFTRIPGTDRYLVTLLREPSLGDDSRDRLPFALAIEGREDRKVLWEGREGRFLARYAKGKLLELEEFAEGAPVSEGCDRLGLLESGPMAQQRASSWSRIRAILTWALAALLLLQVGFYAWSAVAIRERQLADLRGALGFFRSSQERASEKDAGNSPEADFIYKAENLQSAIAAKWLPGFHLTRWRLADDKYALEGWGPGALGLLASLKSSRQLSDARLVSIKKDKGLDFFTFSGGLGDD